MTVIQMAVTYNNYMRDLSCGIIFSLIIITILSIHKEFREIEEDNSKTSFGDSLITCLYAMINYMRMWRG